LDIPILEIDSQVETDQVAALKRVRAERDNGAVKEKLETLRLAAGGSENLMPHLLDCSQAYATLGEITGVLKGVFGEYREPAYF
jgi:methylmalonyl-CoA mutase N-terminal domain/subunit